MKTSLTSKALSAAANALYLLLRDGGSAVAIESAKKAEFSAWCAHQLACRESCSGDVGPSEAQQLGFTAA